MNKDDYICPATLHAAAPCFAAIAVRIFALRNVRHVTSLVSFVVILVSVPQTNTNASCIAHVINVRNFVKLLAGSKEAISHVKNNYPVDTLVLKVLLSLPLSFAKSATKMLTW